MAALDHERTWSDEGGQHMLIERQFLFAAVEGFVVRVEPMRKIAVDVRDAFARFSASQGCAGAA